MYSFVLYGALSAKCLSGLRDMQLIYILFMRIAPPLVSRPHSGHKSRKLCTKGISSAISHTPNAAWFARAAPLQWLSDRPHEGEHVFPPSTYLRPSGRVQRITVGDAESWTVVEVVPRCRGA